MLIIASSSEHHVVRRFRVTIGGKVYEVEVEVADAESEVELLKRLISKPKIERLEGGPRISPGGISAPITGRVLKIEVGPGDIVEEGRVVALMESMKTQVEVVADKSGKVKRVLVEEGQVVKQGELILELE